MKKACLLIIIIAILIASSNVQATDLHGEQPLDQPQEIVDVPITLSPVRYDSAGLDSLIRSVMENSHIPGVATWCSKNGQVVWHQCYGYANLEDSIEVTDTTSFMLASISKTIVGTAIMQLYERGEFGLDDDINDYLQFDVRNPNHPDSAITFKMLMTHTSSIHDNWGMLPPWQPGDPTISLGDFCYGYLVPGGLYYSEDNFNNSVPGTYYDYCNAAIALLGYLVTAIEDSFPVHCQDSIFDPLCLNHTSWFLAGLDANNIAYRYNWTGSSYVRLPHIGSPFYPCAQLRASSVDLAQHLTAVMQYGIIDTVSILDSATVDLMLTQHFYPGGFFVGLTWFYRNIYSRYIWNHGGGMTGVSTFYGFCPAESSAVVVLMNRGNTSTMTYPIVNALFDYAQQYGIEEQTGVSVVPQHIFPTIFHGPLQLPSGRKCKVFDITGRIVQPDMIKPGVYFIEIDGAAIEKVIKIK